MLPGGSAGDATTAATISSMPHPMYVAYNNSLQAQSSRAKQQPQQTTAPPPPPPPPRRSSGKNTDNSMQTGSATQQPAEDTSACSPTVMVIPWMQAAARAGSNTHDLAVYITAEEAAAACRCSGGTGASATPVAAGSPSAWTPTATVRKGTVQQPQQQLAVPQQQQQYHVAGSSASSYYGSSSTISTSPQVQPTQFSPSTGQQQQSVTSTLTTLGGPALPGASPSASGASIVLHAAPAPASPFSAFAGATISNNPGGSSSNIVHSQVYAQPATESQHRQPQQLVLLAPQQQQHSGSLDSSQSNTMTVVPIQVASSAMPQQQYNPGNTMDVGSCQMVFLQSQLSGVTTAAALPGQHIMGNSDLSANSTGLQVMAEQHKVLQGQHQQQQQQQQQTQALEAIDQQLANLLLLRQQISDTPQTVGTLGQTPTSVVATTGLIGPSTLVPQQYGSTVVPQQYSSIEGGISWTGGNYAGSQIPHSSQMTAVSPAQSGSVIMLTQQQQQPQPKPVVYQQVLQPQQQQQQLPQQQQPVVLLGPATAAAGASPAAAAAPGGGVQVAGMSAEQVQARLQELHEAQVTRQQLRAELMRLLPM